MPPQGTSYRGEGGLAGCWPSAGLDRTRHLIESEDGAGGHCSVIGQAGQRHSKYELRLWKIMGENTKIMGQIIGDLMLSGAQGIIYLA